MIIMVLRMFLISMAFALVIGACMVIGASGGPGPDKIEPLPEVLIASSGIAIPLGRILLVRADTCYCAVKFTKAYTEKTGGEYSGEYFATYESWYQGDGTGDFSKSNVVFTRRDLWWRLPIGIGRLWLIMRYRDDIQCGPVTLKWWAQTAISWIPKKMGSGLQTIHFAPTPWMSISEVNVHDPRITWYYRRDDLPEVRIPIDQLWR